MDVETSAMSPPPQRPLVPPKPDKDKINVTGQTCKLSAGQVNFPNKSPEIRKTIHNGASVDGTDCKAKAQQSETSELHRQQDIRRDPIVSTQGPLNIHQKPPISPQKPALPPKPVASLVSYPPKKSVTCPQIPKSAPCFPKSGNSVSIANSILANRNRNTIGTGLGDINLNAQLCSSSNSHNPDSVIKESLRSPPLVLRRHSDFHKELHPVKSPSEPVSPRPTININPRPSSSIFSFPSREVNLNTSTIHQSPRHLELLRSKSASLGRNSAPPSTSGGFFTNKANALARILPLDLHFGKNQSKTKSSTLPTMQPPNWPSPIQNFGKKISFSTNSGIPPPPPPRLKRKLSPVNSLSPVSSLSPTSPPPVFSPVNQLLMTSVSEEPAIYAEIDKEKKWAERKLKKDENVDTTGVLSEYAVEKSSDHPEHDTKEIQASLVITINRDINNQQNIVNIKSLSEETGKTINNELTSQKMPQKCSGNLQSAEGAIVDSWLGKYLSEPVVPPKPKKFEPSIENIGAELRACVIHSNGVTDGLENDSRADSITFDSGDFNKKPNENKAVNNSNEQMLVENKSFLFGHSLNKKPELLIDNDNCIQSINITTEDNCITATEQQNMTASDEFVIGDTNLINFPVSGDVKSSNETETVLDENTSSVTTTELIEVVTNERTDLSKDEIPNAETILQLVDTKIQSAVSLLSNLSGKVSPSHQITPMLSSDSPIIENFESLSITEVDFLQKDSIESTPSQLESSSSLKDKNDSFENSLSIVQTPNTPKELTDGVISEDNLFLRRRSWNCSGDSSSPSSSSSLCNLRDRSFTYSSGRSTLGWVDEGELSTGALADADSSDTQVPNSSSTEDMGGGGSISRRKRMWIFSSFGKPGSSSSCSSNGNQKTPKKHKDKIKSSESNGKSSTLGRFGRQVSESVLTTAQISGPISLPEELSKSTTKPTGRSHSTVQFSPDVIETPIYRYRYSERNVSEALESPLSLSLGLPIELEKVDNESISSESSINIGSSSNASGYDDILAELSPKNKKAFYVAREILTSEQTFIDVLNLLTVDFPNAIKHTENLHRQPVIPPQDMDNILAGLSNLKRVNEELKIDLEERIKNWLDNPKLADIIVKKGPFLKLYAHYIKNFEKTTQHLDSCCQRYPGFAKALLDFELSDNCHKLGLKHYMLKPVQRMPQYRLLLEDYLKNLDASSNDHEDTIKAIAIVRDVAEHANEAIRLQVNAEKLMHLQNRLVGAVIMKADRQLLKEGELLKVCRKQLQPRFFALMNDCLLCMTYNVGAGSTKDLKMRNELPLAGMRICLTATEDYANEFSVISISRSFNLVAKSPREREEWMKALNNAIHDNIKKRTCSTPDQEDGFQLGKVAPVWIQDSRVTMCQICTAEFTVTFRRHHCRSCGKVVCGHCSGNQAPLQYLKNDAARVCDECYQFLLEEFDKESRESNSEGLETSRDTIRIRFKKVTPNVSKRAAKVKRSIPSRLEVHANNSGSRISGYLHWRERKAWKRYWFVLMDRVLYIYAASEDIVAIRSIPVLGWGVDFEKSECMDGGDSDSVFKLTHTGQNTLLFQADNLALAERWVAAMTEATVLT